MGGLFSRPKIRIAAPRARDIFRSVQTPAFSLVSPKSGVFNLRRLDPFVPQRESELLSVLRGRRGQVFSRLFPELETIGEQIRLGESRIPGLFAGSAALRGDLAGLAAEVRPAFGRLTESAVETIRNRAQAAAGNLRAQLGKRGLLGSSFAAAELSRTALDFAQVEEQARAEAIVREIDMRRQLVFDAGKLLELDQRSLATQATFIGLRFGLTQEVARGFALELANIQSEMQLLQQRANRELTELGIAGNIINKVQAVIAQTATTQAQLAAQAAQAQGSFFGNIFGLGLGALAFGGFPIFGGTAPAAAPASFSTPDLFGGAAFT